ncbi:hypothetical protein MCOR25_009520 [Pyricularia grisea]|nr:hypothetical protein MCOR25_009520 [Pyricularia grisea]
MPSGVWRLRPCHQPKLVFDICVEHRLLYLGIIPKCAYYIDFDYSFGDKLVLRAYGYSQTRLTDINLEIKFVLDFQFLYYRDIHLSYNFFFGRFNRFNLFDLFD